jgi:hypothetical protein
MWVLLSAARTSCCDPQVREFQVVQDGPVLRILVVPGRPSSPAAGVGEDTLETRVGQAIAQQLHGLGADDPQVTVERRQQLPRSAGGKLKLVIADPASQPVHAGARQPPTILASATPQPATGHP